MAKDLRMGVVVHSYGYRWNSKADSAAYPAFVTTLDLLDHCHQIGAGGVQSVVNGWSTKFAKSVRAKKEKLGMYFEGSVGLPKAGKTRLNLSRTCCGLKKRARRWSEPYVRADGGTRTCTRRKPSPT